MSFRSTLDGQQVTSDLSSGGQPRYSQDSIAEFQLITNRFDATQGRSTGRAGERRSPGRAPISSPGCCAPTFVTAASTAGIASSNLVEPINNQQFSSTLGGPILRDKFHFFVNYEYEREPRTAIWRTPYPFFNASIDGTNNQKKGGGRLDDQLSSEMRLMGKVSGGRLWEPFGPPSATNHPAATGTTLEYNDEYLGQLTQVLSNRALNEIRVGKTAFGYDNRNLTSWSNHWARRPWRDDGVAAHYLHRLSNHRQSELSATQRPGRVARTRRFHVLLQRERTARSEDGWGGHHRASLSLNCRQCMGLIDARNGPTPSAAQLQAWFPDPFNVDTWNLAAISPLVRSYTISTGTYRTPQDSTKLAVWAQDDWQISDRLTLNLGVRYDAGFGMFANDISFPPFQDAGRPDDLNNVQPRFGFAYRLTDRTVIRGGSGLYYGDALSGDQGSSIGNTQLALLGTKTTAGRTSPRTRPTAGRCRRSRRHNPSTATTTTMRPRVSSVTYGNSRRYRST